MDAIYGKTMANPPKRKCRKYSEDYLKFGFVSSLTNVERPMCLLCERTFSNEAMKPSKMKDHIRRMHPVELYENLEFFETLREKFYNRSKPMLMFVNHSLANSGDNNCDAEANLGDTIENTSRDEDNGESSFGHRVNPVTALEHNDAESSGSVNPFTASKRQKIQHRISTLKNVVNDHKNMSMSHTNQSEENEFDIYGLYVSTSLKKLSLPRAIRLQEKINSLIADERINYDSQSSPCSNNGIAERNHGSDNVDKKLSFDESYLEKLNDVKTETVQIECEPELDL